MKFLILSACVCMAVAAPQRFGQSPVRKAAGVAASPFVAAAQVTSQAASAVVSTGARAASAVAGSDADAQILRSESDVRADGFSYNGETANGIVYEASGNLKQVDNQNVLVIQGRYNYVSPDGTPVQFTYVADENGYQPQSDLLPVGPPVPEAIARSLEYIAAHPYEEVKRN